MRLTSDLERKPAIGKRGGVKVANGASVPAPIEGWDAVSPLAAMSPKRAVKLDNWFPQPGWVEVRKGFVRHSTTGVTDPVETIATYNGVSTKTMFAAVTDSIYDVTIAGTATVSVTGLTNARWQYVNFTTTGGHFLYMVNGADLPQYFDGATWATPTITGISAPDIIGINAFKNRLWFVLNDSSDAAYLPVDSIQGAAVLFPLGGLFTKGGFLMAMGTWSIDAGDGPDDYAVFLSSRGQCAIYRGTNPASAATWELVGVFDMGAPLGRRCMTRVGADIALICIDGVVPLSRAMIFERAAVVKVSLTERIQRVMNQSARLYGDHFGWQLISYPRGTRAILNVPIVENGDQVQYVMNTLSGAWCQFIGMQANCWELLDEDPYFGGNDGVVYKADTSGNDAGNTLSADMMTAFNYYGSHGNQKRWTMCRPQLTTDGAVLPGLGFNVDFRDDAPLSVSSTQIISSSLWDVALWDVGTWSGGIRTIADWTSVTGIGYCASIRLAVDLASAQSTVAGIWGIGLWGDVAWSNTVTDEVVLQVNAFDLTYEMGAIV
jgi:hypothetical protein